MTPREKARELVDKIQEGLWRDRAVKIYQEDAVYSALIAVDELQKAVLQYSQAVGYGIRSEDTFWQDVKKELENF